MTAGPSFMARAIAAIIDPEAFAVGADKQATSIVGRRREALKKAERIASMDFLLEDLPKDLQGAAELLGEVTGKDLLVSSASAFAPKLAEDGGTVYTGLVRAQPDGTLLVLAFLGGDDEEEGSWLAETFACDPARKMAAELETIAAGGGHA